jgi:uncharacterized protein YbbC (DUF1343 family)
MRVFVPVHAATLAAVLTLTAYAQTPATSPPARVQLGIDVLLADGCQPLRGKRVGLITNPTGVTRDLRSTIDVLHAAAGVQLVALFGPEHGVRGDEYAGDTVGDTHDPATGLPMYSLYGKTRKATPEMLKDLDVLVYDIQDIGSRSYTYISTLALAMEAAAENDIAVVVLDRPNPLGGERLEGRPLDLKYQSFVGHLPIPYLHGLTVGELARMIDGEGWLPNGLKCELTVIPMKGWRRAMSFAETGLNWVPTSPHVPRADTSLFYAATGIMGETHAVSEGVGYTLPFELIGAPGLDAAKLATALNERRLPGIHFRPLYFKPFYGSLEKKLCGGVQVVFTAPRDAALTPVQFHAIDVIRTLDPERKFFGGKRDAMFDKVCGTDGVRKMFLEGRPIDEIVAFWNEGVEEFRTQRRPYLLYD